MKYLTFLLFTALASAQTNTNLITPVTILPKADHSACGVLRFPLANNTNPVLMDCSGINASSIGGAYTITGASGTNGKLVLNPGAGGGNQYVEFGGDLLPSAANQKKVGYTTQRFLEVNSNTFSGVNGSSTSTFNGINTAGTVFQGACSTGANVYCLSVTGSSGLTPSAILSNSTAGGAGVVLQIQAGTPLSFSQNAALWVSTESQIRPAAIIMNNTPAVDQAALYVINNAASSNRRALYVDGATMVTRKIYPVSDQDVDLGIAGTSRWGAYYGKTITLSGSSGGGLLTVTTSGSVGSSFANASGPALDIVSGFGLQVQSIRMNPANLGGELAIYGSGSSGGTSTTLNILSESGGSVSTAGGGTSFWAVSDGTHSINIGVASNAATLKINGNTVIDDSRNATVNNLTVNGTCTGCSAAFSGAWSSYTPSTTHLSSTSTTAASITNSKSTFVRLQVTGTSDGTNPALGLPNTPASSAQTLACTITTSGATVNCVAVFSSSTVVINVYDNSALANGTVYTINVQGVYENT